MPIQKITSGVIESVANTQVTGTITASQIATVNANTITSGTIPLAQVPRLTGVKMPTGTILQVVQGSGSGITASTTTYPNSSTRGTACSVSITPTSASSKIYVTYSGWWYPYDSSPAGANQVGQVGAIYRGSTLITVAGSWQLQLATQTVYTYYGMQSFCVLDSPSTTSPTTYSLDIYAWAGNSSSIVLREAGGAIIAMEVAQ